jgi:hypothetical protein
MALGQGWLEVAKREVYGEARASCMLKNATDEAIINT